EMLLTFCRHVFNMILGASMPAGRETTGAGLRPKNAAPAPGIASALPAWTWTAAAAGLQC
ncbi:MAG TPA: hypothetical protein P5572_12260, partial [Phycisphaerae bacterium]|nr:hypothetical protein [Phycisphaerae bacterium]